MITEGNTKGNIKNNPTNKRPIAPPPQGRSSSNYTVIFKLEEEPEKWTIQKHKIGLQEAIKLRDDLLSCGNVVAAEILIARTI